MRDERFPAFQSDDDPRLGAALRELPLAAPAGSAWPEMAAALAAQRKPARARGLLPALASAAVLALAVGLALKSPAPEQPASVAAGSEQSPAGRDPTGEPTTGASSDLIARNRELEMMLRGIDRMPLDAESALAGAQLEDLIGMLDLELSATREDARARLLWQQRLVLLQELATVRQTGFAAVAQDAGIASLQPATYVVD